MSSNCQALKVLMLKHLTVRIRRFISTPFELISPLIFIALIVYVNHAFRPQRSSNDKTDAFRIQQTIPFQLESTRAPSAVLYTPNTTLTNKLMEFVALKLNLQRLDEYPKGLVRGYYALEPGEENMTLTSRDALVKFKDMEGESWPEKLEYVIRMKENFLPHIYEPLDGTTGPHEYFGTIYEPFMRLQWSIDSSFIELNSKKPIPQKITMQEFPYMRTAEDDSWRILMIVAIIFVSPFFLIMPYMLHFSRLLEGRVTGVQELLKMIGVTPTILNLSHFLNSLPAGVLYATVGPALFHLTPHPILAHCNILVSMTIFLLHYCTIIALAFVFSYLPKTTQYSSTIGFFSYDVLALVPMVARIKVATTSRLVALLLGLLPQMPLLDFWFICNICEALGKAPSLTFRPKAGGMNLLECYCLLVLQCVIFFSLAMYLERVRPGQYGTPQPWNFLCRRDFWCKQRVEPDSELEEQGLQSSHDPAYFETLPTNKEVGIKVVNVTKEYGWTKNRVLSNVSLDIYKGEITILLGHNGAGKTTLMSIISGMNQATSGDVFINGHHSVRESQLVRRHIGLCPQHNLFFADLTVQQHTMFFAMLKGQSVAEARKSSAVLLNQLGLGEKLSSLPGALSGGMKRRLQLSCALAGGADVLLLDEPTSGLDVHTRRSLWDMLLSLRGSRTVVLTTHYMEEADALGDRVAALHTGVLKCHATPMYLKRAVGTGYRLSLVTHGMPREGDITQAIHKLIPEATVREKTFNSISYNVPSKSSTIFPKLFSTLEGSKQQLSVESIGVGITTLEEVFLELCSDVNTALDEVDSAPAPVFEKVSGLRLVAQQVKALLNRQYRHTISKIGSFACLQVAIPLLLVLLTIVVTNTVTDEGDKSGSAMSLNMYKQMAEPAVMLSLNRSGAADQIEGLRRSFPGIHFKETPDVEHAILRTAQTDILDYNKHLAGIEMNDTHTKVLYTTVVRHAAPSALNLLSNMLAGGRAISTVNDPVAPRAAALVMPKEDTNVLLYAILVVLVVLSTIMNVSTLCCMERVSGARHIHVASGCSPLVHWGTTLAYHTLTALLCLILPIVLLTCLLEEQHTLDTAGFLGTALVILVLGCMAFFAFIYLISFFAAERATSLLLVVFMILGCLLTPAAIIATEMTAVPPDSSTPPEQPSSLDRVLEVVGYLLPPHSMTVGLMKAGSTARFNALCALNRERCPGLLIPDTRFDAARCCSSPKGTSPFAYWDFGRFSPGFNVVQILIQLTVYMSLVLLKQKGTLSAIWERITNHGYVKPDKGKIDRLVEQEKVYVDKAIAQPKSTIGDAFLASDIHKYYKSLFGKSFNAVKGIDFSVKKGECFGLLGVNGAGKSTTFKMIMAEECPTRGKLFANGHFQHSEKSKYLPSLGYCPQFFGLDMFLTGQQNLALLLTLRGLRRDDVRREVDYWIQIVGLERHARKKASSYSGGCVRRLATACALSSRTPLSLLDEPTAGVDAAARRRVWTSLRRALTGDSAVVITSHSMDEMEALCQRIAIMSRGRVCAIGSASQLRAAHATGHAVQLKIKPTADEAASLDQVNRLKAEFLSKFNSSLKDEHKTMLHFHINETLPYSKLFADMELLKQHFGIIEDYAVSETTLEEVFLSFAEPPPESPGGPA